jgi:hypothetical protein
MEVQYMKKCILLVAVVGLMAGMATITRADDLADLKQQLAELQKKVDALETKQADVPVAGSDSTQTLQKRMEELELAQATQERQNLAMSQKMEMGTLPANLKWLESIKLSGDIRVRYERIDLEGDSKPDRNRARFRARLQLDAPVSPEWSIGLRLASDEGGDPVSTNQTFGDSLSKKPVYIDLAYIDYHPAAVTGLNVLAGKMNNPFYTVGKNQLIWDGDLTPEGIAVTYKHALSDSLELFSNGGAFYITENENGNDLSLYGIQAGLKYFFDKDTYLLGGASYYTYDDIKGKADLDRSTSTKKFYGNSNDGTYYTSNYRMANLFGEYGSMVGTFPVTVFGDYVKNTAAVTDADTGWLVGAKLNKMKKAGSWELSYDYRELQADATLGIFSDSDFIGGGTDGRGHRFGVGYQLTDNVQTGLNYYLNKKNVSNVHQDYDRLQADVMVKF